MDIETEDLDDDLEPMTSRKPRFPEEHVIADTPWSWRRIFLPGLSGHCTQVLAEEMINHSTWVERSECRHVVSFYVRCGPKEESMAARFYREAWTRFRSRLKALPGRLGLETWRIAKSALDSHGEDLLVIEMDGFEEPMWTIVLRLENRTTYGDLSATVTEIEQFMYDLEVEIDGQD